MSVNTANQTKILRIYFEQYIDSHSEHFYQTNAKQQILEAFDFAAEAHKNTLRFSGEPFISHPIEVAKIVTDKIGLGTRSVIAALLHDVPDKTEITIETIAKHFEPRIVKILDGLQRVKKSEFFDNNTQASTFRQILLTMSDDLRVILIKIADKLHNLRTINYLPENIRKKAVTDILNIYAPLAHRLGLYEVKSEMEDLCLMYSNPAIYNTIREKLDDTERDRKQFISDFLAPIKHVLSHENIKFRIESRTKSIYSLWKKMQVQHVPFEEVYDLFAVRVIFTPHNNDDDKTEALKIGGLITEIYDEKIDRTRNWLETTKETGYRALHVTVMSKQNRWVEVQIRSEAMHEVAEFGFASHTKYKGIEEKKSEFDAKVRNVLNHLNEDKLNASDFLDELKINLFTSEIFVFTHGGEPVNLPKSATALDLAFKVHTNLALKSIAAKVNGLTCGLDTVLKSGDVVEIINSRNQVPQKEWLNFVITQKALTVLRKVFKEERQQLINEGREKINQILESESPDNKKFALATLTKKLHIKNESELYLQAGEGRISKAKIVNVIQTFCKDTKANFWYLKFKNSTDKSVKLNWRKKFELAECCNPTPNENIVGINLPNEPKTQVHRVGCSVFTSLKSFGHQELDVQWISYETRSELTQISVTGRDRIGILSQIVNVLSSDFEVNIRNLKLETENDIFKVDAEILTKTEDLAEELQTKLAALPDVYEVEISYS